MLMEPKSVIAYTRVRGGTMKDSTEVSYLLDNDAT